MKTVYDAHQDPGLNIDIELKDNVKDNLVLADKYIESISVTLREANSEYNRLFEVIGKDIAQSQFTSVWGQKVRLRG